MNNKFEIGDDVKVKNYNFVPNGTRGLVISVRQYIVNKIKQIDYIIKMYNNSIEYYINEECLESVKSSETTIYNISCRKIINDELILVWHDLYLYKDQADDKCKELNNDLGKSDGIIYKVETCFLKH